MEYEKGTMQIIYLSSDVVIQTSNGSLSEQENDSADSGNFNDW